VVREFSVVVARCLVLALLLATQDAAADGLACLLAGSIADRLHASRPSTSQPSRTNEKEAGHAAD
jgi:hypothetical protein